MKWTEHVIARAVATQTLAKKCVVLVDNCNWTGHECDILAVTTDLRVVDVEVKISRADLKADARKDKWWHRRYGAWLPNSRDREAVLTPRSHPPKVWKHYYALPQAIWSPDLLACLPNACSGVLLLREGVGRHAPAVVVEVARRSTPARDAGRLTPSQVLDIARLANIRMWEAYGKLAGVPAADDLSDLGL